MKGTEAFKTTIQNHLNERANSDKEFAKSFAKETKNLDDCITYILNKVKDSGCNGFTDAEVFGMASEYYINDNVKVGSKINSTVVVNHKIAEEKPEKKEEKPKAKAKSKLKVVVNNTTEAKPTEKPKFFEPTLF